MIRLIFTLIIVAVSFVISPIFLLVGFIACVLL
jgi:hypothetical protein